MRQFIFVSSVLIAFPSLAPAQSILERVLRQIDGATNLAPVNVAYVNIAESISLETQTLERVEIPAQVVPMTVETAPEQVFLAFIWPKFPDGRDMPGASRLISSNDLGTVIENPFGEIIGGDAISIGLDGYVSILDRDGAESKFGIVPFVTETSSVITDTSSPLSLSLNNGFIFPQGGSLWLRPEDYGPRYSGVQDEYLTVTIPASVEFIPHMIGVSSEVDGSILNVITGVTIATAEVVGGAVVASEFALPSVGLGDMSTTALGAVNTGDITVGVNATADEAKTSTAQAISSLIMQVGGSADTGALVLNAASNAATVNASITNTISHVNGSVGALSTTTLGSVNTGTIVSGVNSAVAAIGGMSDRSGL
jgi:hypothetical protein